MRDLIYDPRTGNCVAFVENDEVFLDRKGRLKIATVRAGNVYDLKGDLVGHLEGFLATGPYSPPLPDPFRKLLAASTRPS
jgi:hypothetical protein